MVPDAATQPVSLGTVYDYMVGTKAVLAEHGERLNRIETKLPEHDHRFNQTDRKLDEVPRHLGGSETQT